MIGGVVHGTWTALSGAMKPEEMAPYVMNTAMSGTMMNGTSRYGLNTIGRPKMIG